MSVLIGLPSEQSGTHEKPETTSTRPTIAPLQLWKQFRVFGYRRALPIVLPLRLLVRPSPAPAASPIRSTLGNLTHYLLASSLCQRDSRTSGVSS